MTVILTTFIGIFIGAYVNNVLTWKIKNKIEFIDDLLKKLLEFDTIAYNTPAPRGEIAHTILTNPLCKELNNIESKIRLLLITLSNEDLKNNIENYLDKRRKLFYIGLSENTQMEKCILENNQEIKLEDDVFPSILLYRQKITSFCYMLKELNPCKCRCQK